MKARKNGDTIFPYKPSKFPYQSSEQSETKTGEGDGELYMPDIDIKSMFLRYDNRLNRKRYILRSITVAVAVIVVAIILSVIANKLGSGAIAALGILVSALPIIPAFMLSIRRLHDLNCPGWWCIGFFIPMINFVLSFYLIFFKGTKGPNQFGPDPLSSKE
jgi:uncharacterized membrane protein YhaH (DUF805 family)